MAKCNFAAHLRVCDSKVSHTSGHLANTIYSTIKMEIIFVRYIDIICAILLKDKEYYLRKFFYTLEYNKMFF